MGLTKFVLKRPVTTILSVICLIVFGLSSVLSSKLELIPEMDMPGHSQMFRKALNVKMSDEKATKAARRTSANW